MTVILCPGVHPPELTESFLRGFSGQLADYLVFPSDSPPYSALHVLDFLHRQFTVPHPKTCRHMPRVPLLFIGFSAGVVGAIGAALAWRSMGRSVKALIAFDGWGVPLYGDFPIYHISHDAFTHCSSTLWRHEDSFYADPSIAHLDLWRSPHTAEGWHVHSAGVCWGGERRTATTAAKFLLSLLARYEEVTPITGDSLPHF